MIKIITVINVMISNSDKITKIITGSALSSEYFFIYDNKYKWSIYKSDEDAYSIHYYPENVTIEKLSGMSKEEWRGYDKYITYSTEVIKTRESYETMNELYNLLKEKIIGIDDVFNDIIKGDSVF